ncbi:MAG: hypothetical protein ACFFG0_45910 [Candidatus Thorarchaeota archaeon]
MKRHFAVKRRCSICKIKVKPYKTHLKEEHQPEYIRKKLKILIFLERFFKLFPFSYFILLTLSYFVSNIFDIIIFITIPIFIFLFIVFRIKTKKAMRESLVYFIDEYQTLKQELDEKEKKSRENGKKISLEDALKKLFSVQDNSYKEDFIISWIQKVFNDENFNEINLIKGVQDKLNEKLLSIIEKLDKFMDREELELSKFLISKEKHHYFFWIAFQITVFTIGIILSILTNIIEEEFYFLYVLLLVIYIFNYIQSKMNDSFNKGHYRFVKNKSFLKKYKNLLSLILFNSYFRTNEHFPNLEEKINLFGKRVDTYKGILSHYLDYLKKFEFIAILGIIISYFYPLFQPSVMFSFFYEHSLDMIIAALLILGLFVYPFINRRRDETIVKIHSELGKELGKYIEEVNFCILIYNLTQK